MELWTAFILGFVGSLHCAAMCGPLALAVPVVGKTKSSLIATRLIFNGGRIATYCALGLVFGILGRTLSLAGFQQWLSIVVGSAILLALVFSRRAESSFLAVKPVLWLKQKFSTFLQRRGYPARFVLGALNGLLPCGLVYVAAAGAVATGGVSRGTEYMLVFGLGTLPMMLGIAVCGTGFKRIGRLPVRNLIPGSVAVMATLLILRGLGLGIPLVSPALESGKPTCCPAPSDPARP